jgi:hypothetical protein
MKTTDTASSRFVRPVVLNSAEHLSWPFGHRACGPSSRPTSDSPSRPHTNAESLAMTRVPIANTRFFRAQTKPKQNTFRYQRHIREEGNSPRGKARSCLLMFDRLQEGLHDSCSGVWSSGWRWLTPTARSTRRYDTPGLPVHTVAAKAPRRSGAFPEKRRHPRYRACSAGQGQGPLRAEHSSLPPIPNSSIFFPSVSHPSDRFGNNTISYSHLAMFLGIYLIYRNLRLGTRWAQAAPVRVDLQAHRQIAS